MWKYAFLVPFFGVFLALSAAEMRPLPWSEATNSAARFGANSSGKMTAVDDAKEKAVRFDVEFTPGTDFWVYPVLRLAGSLDGVEQIRFEFKTEGASGCRHAYVMFGKEQPYYALPEPKNTYQLVAIDVAKAVKDPTQVTEIRIGMNPRDAKFAFWIRNLEFLTSRKPSSPFDVADAVSVTAPGSVFLQGEALNFKLKPWAVATSKWKLSNWKDEVIREGEWPGKGKQELVLDSLPNGYYKLELTSDSVPFTGFRSFTVVPDPDKRGRNPEMFFAIDSGQSWLARPDAKNFRHPQDAYETVSEVARRLGVAMVRERLSWGEVEPAPGKFDWKQYKLNADLLAERGVTISGMYHNAPAWAKGNTTNLPSDLAAAYNFAKKAAETFKGQMTVWEFWNEQDIGFAPEAAWDYAAALKAASLGFKAADPKMPVAIGGYAHIPIPTYADVVMQNGAGEYFDIFNTHTYRQIREFPEIVRNVRQHMARHKISDRPIWFTENGSLAEGSGRSESYIPGLKAHDPDQELLIAEYIPKMMIAMQSLGVSRDFFFVLPPYNEGGGNKDWGLMRRDFTVKPGYTAFATLIDRLGDAVLEGEVALGKGVKGYLYRRKDGSKTLVYWSLSELDTEGQRPNLSPKDRLERSFPLRGKFDGIDLFGTPFRTDGVKATATRFPAFLDQVTGVKVSVPFQAPATRGAGKSESDKTVIFRTELSEDFVLFAGKDCMDVTRENARFKLQVWNLAAQPKEGKVNITGGKVTGLPEKVTLPAFGKVEYELTFTPEFDKEFKGALHIDGVFNGRRTTPLHAPVQNLKEMADSGRQVPMPQLLDPANWRKNAAGQMDITYDDAEQAIRFATTFPSNVDRWVYPEYVLQLPQESLKGALGIGLEVKVSSAAAVKHMLIMAVLGKEQEQGKSVYLPITAPGEVWQERFVQIPPSLDPDKVQQLRLGLNSLEDDITYWVRNIRIYYAR